MARLILLLCAIGVGLLQASVFPQGNANGEQAAVLRLEQLLANPLETDSNWRRRVWVQLRSLEHGPVERVRLGWETLSRSGSDQDRANLLLYQRRHSLPLLELQDDEGPEATLERCLFLWGEKLLPVTRQALVAAVERFPADGRFSDNLRWLELFPPTTLPLDGRPRDFALAVLAARNALH